jgi:hypothetical protein
VSMTADFMGRIPIHEVRPSRGFVEASAQFDGTHACLRRLEGFVSQDIRILTDRSCWSRLRPYSCLRQRTDLLDSVELKAPQSSTSNESPYT